MRSLRDASFVRSVRRLRRFTDTNTKARFSGYPITVARRSRAAVEDKKEGEQ
jgi:hypothetical protein